MKARAGGIEWGFIYAKPALYNHFYYNYFSDLRQKYSYDKIFDGNLFKKIEDAIKQNYNLDKTQYKVMTIVKRVHKYVWFVPYLAQVNGFQVIDGYNPIWNKDYYEKVMSVMDTNYFIRGNPRKIYFIPSSRAINDGRITSLRLDTATLKEINCRFILSPYEITGCPDIELFGVFKGELWTIYVYEVI